MMFLVYRASAGTLSRTSPCPGAVRGPESAAWPGEYPWFLEVASLEELMAFLERSGGAIGLFSPEEDEEYPAIEIFDDEEADG
jgi:hypothetical protein